MVTDEENMVHIICGNTYIQNTCTHSKFLPRRGSGEFRHPIIVYMSTIAAWTVELHNFSGYMFYEID